MTFFGRDSGPEGEKSPLEVFESTMASSTGALPRERTESAMFLAAIIVVLLISKSVDNWVLINATAVDIYSNTFVWAYTAALCAPMLAYVLWIKRPLHEFGVTFHNWKQSLTEAMLISGVVLLLGAFALMFIGMSEGKNLTDFIKPDWLKFENLAYIPHSILQEFIFRGVVLTALVRIFRSGPLWQALLLSNLLFSFVHMHLGFSAVVITFFIGLLFSGMYLRHGNILGISLAHIVLGSAAFLFGVV